MTITSTSIRLLESERMADTSDGGGRRTSRAIPDGVAGNVFPKISRLDSVYGRLHLRKIYAHVDTASVEVYAGAHAIITDAPDNPRIGVVLFATGSDFHVRADARDQMESYVVAGPESRMVVYGRQLKGASAVLVYQREEESLPEVGDVFCLSDEPGGVQGGQQYMVIQAVEHEVRTFDDNGSDFRRRVITLRIGAPLRQEFRGISSPSRSSGARGSTLLRVTKVADAARYYGIQPLTEAAMAGTLELKVASVYAPIVPTAQREAPISLAAPPGSSAAVDAGTAIMVDGPFSQAFEAGQPFTAITTLCPKPGTLVVRTLDGGFRSEDDGLGILTPKVNAAWTGSVDYASRTLTLVAQFGGGVQLVIEYLPQVEVSQAAHTRAEKITIATRGTVYTPVLNPLPAPGTFRVDYRALARWYGLRDRGDGELQGADPAYGTGLVNFLTGGAALTLGELPDVGSSNIYTWGSPIHYEKRLADTGGKAYQVIELEHTPIAPGELDIEYLSDGVTYTVSMDASGVFSGAGCSGSMNLATGKGVLEYATRLPDYDSALAISYKSWALDPSQTIVGGAVNTKLLTDPTAIGEAVLPGTLTGLLTMSLTATIADVSSTTEETMVPFAVDAAGVVRCSQETGLRNNRVRITLPVGTVLGSMNNGTGVVTYNPNMLLPTTWYVAGVEHPTWSQGAYLCDAQISAASVTYTPAVYTTSGGAEIPAGTATRVYSDHTVDLSVENDAPVQVDLTRTSTATLVAGSVVFTLAGKRFSERNGTLYIDALLNGSATAAGTFDYASGVAKPALWVRGAALGLAVQAAVIKLGDWSATSAYFRTAGSPLRPASTYVQVTALDGTLLSATADASGNITSAFMHGTVEQTMGVVSLRFGEWLPVAGNEAAPWFDPANVEGFNVLRPIPVQPQTLRYSAVVITSLPLSADILGIDPVRLPTDGRAPVYRAADVGVIHHTAIHNVGTPIAGAVIDVDREGLSALWLEDANRKKLAANLYAADLDAGLVTMDAGLSLVGYAPPIAARHRIEEMFTLTDVQINGQVGISAPLSRDFPMGSQLSSALPFGDLFARVEHVFDQRTWTGVWSNSLIGDQADQQFNDIDYPIEVLNESAVNERWRWNFTSNTGNGQLIGENLGVVWAGNISADIAPVNPLTGDVYVVIRKQAWGVAAWPVGAQLRFNTVPAAPGFWLARTTLPGAALTGDSFDAQLRGDAD